MNIKELIELTTYLNTLSEKDQSRITIGACFDGYVFIEDYFGDTLDAKVMHDMGYIYIDSEEWWALEREL